LKIAILHFENIKKPLTGDGAYFLNLSQSLIERGHTVDILSAFDTPSRVFLWLDRIKRSGYTAFLLARAHKLNRYDIVLFTEPLYPHNLALLRYLKRRIKPEIVLYTNMPSIVNNLYYAPINTKFPALISAEITRPFAEKIASRVKLLSPGVDVRKLRPMDRDKKWDFLYIGHLYKEKGVLLLLQAMKLLREKRPSLRLKIIHTSSSEENSYREYISDNRLDNVDIERAIINDHTSTYNSTRVFVYPGIAYGRVAATPLTIIEASACGLPVVTTTLYRHINLPNITFAETDPESLADAMFRVIDGWNLEKQGQTLSAIHRDWSLESMGGSSEAFFTEVINGCKKTG